MKIKSTSRAADVADRRQGLSLFVVDVNRPGIELHPLDIGIVMPDRQYSVFFTDVRVPADRLIGDEGEGVRLLFDALNCERLLAFFFSSRRRHTRSVSAFLLNRSSDLLVLMLPLLVWLT